MASQDLKQLNLLQEKNDHLHRKAGSGLVVTLSRAHLSEYTTTLPKELVARMNASSSVENVHTARIQLQLETALIAMFLDPANRHLNVDDPDTNLLMDLGAGKLVRKPLVIQDWSDLGWAYRWSPRDLRVQLGYQKKRNINLRVQLSNFLNVIERVWLPASTEDRQLRDPSMVDVFLNVNSWETKKSLKDQNDDAFYFNISPVYVTELLNSPKATVIYNRKLINKLRSPKAIDLANYLLMHMNLSDKQNTEVQTTPLEAREGMYNIFNSGDTDPRKMPWKEFAAEYITKHVKSVKKEFELEHLKFCTNRKRENQMLCWFEYKISPVFAGAYADDLPQAFLPMSVEKVTSAVEVTKPIEAKTFTSRDKYSWAGISTETVFITELSKEIDDIGIDVNVAAVISAYTEQAAQQTRKSLRAWISPIRRWLTGTKHPFRHPEVRSHPKTVRVALPKGPAQRTTEPKVPFKLDLIDNQTIQRAAEVIQKVSPENFRINDPYNSGYFIDDTDRSDFATWCITRFETYHISTNTEPQTIAQWQSLFVGFCKNAADRPDMKQKYRSQPFKVSFITEEEPFSSEIKRYSNSDQKLIHRFLELFKIEHSNQENSFAKWQQMAWRWLRREEVLKAAGIKFNKLTISV